MTNDRQLVDMIERANDDQPFCACGWHTTPVWRDGAIWLECASLSEKHEGRLARLVAAASARIHAHVRIVDVPAAPGDRGLLAQT
jgi:hypothetical protein